MKEITKKEFTGIFKEEFENFLRYKKALGYYKKIEGNLLYDYLALNRFLDSYKLEEIAITEEMTFAYVKTAEHLSQSTRHHRECNIRQFAKFLKSQGYENIYIQYDCTVKMPRDYIPYVFSDAEMKRIFSVIDSRESAYDRYDSRLFYQTLIRLLYCTGLRLGEALELKISDIDFIDNIIIVNSGKGNVSRLVPFKASLSKWLINYNRKKSKPGDTYFFASPSGGRRCNHSITTTFRKNILPKAGVSLASAEIFLDEKLPHFIAGTVHALSYYGAVPKYLVPDNLKTAVTMHSKDELVLQSAFSDLETFYDTVILPPPPRKPKGKPTVENHVRFLETHLVEELKKDTYTSLETLNAAVKKIVADINQRPFQKKSDIRKSRMNGFEKYDKPRMNQLPGESYTLCDYKYFLKVPDNYHLEYDAHYYSVLYTYKGKPAILKATMTEIRICDEYNRLICRHPRSYRDFPLYITDDSHMPPEHLYYKEVNAHDGAYYRRWASVYGESMVTLIDRILRSSKHEEQAYNSCAGVFHSCKDVPHRLVREAAEKCVEANACKYSYFKKVLGMIQNNHSSSGINGKLPSHTNIRGKEAYK